MKNLFCIALVLSSLVPATCQLVSFSMGRLDSRLVPDAEALNSTPYWKTDKTNWYAVKFAGADESSKFVWELRLKQKKGRFSVEGGSQASSSGLGIDYKMTRLDLEFRRKLRLFYPKFLYAEAGVFSGINLNSKASGNEYLYVMAPFNINQNRSIEGSAKEYVRNFDMGFALVLGAEYMFTKNIGVCSQLFFNQGLLKAWDGKMCPARDWGWGIGLKLLPEVKR